MEIAGFWYTLLSLAAGFAVALAFVWGKPRSMLLLVLLAIVLFLLFGPFAIPGFFVGLGIKALLNPSARKSAKGRKDLRR